MNHEAKKEETSIDLNQRISVENILEKVPVDELLGSVTTYPEGNDKNQSLRSSARVFKKIKLDANLNAAISTNNGLDKTEKKEEQKIEQTPIKDQKKLKPSWSIEDRIWFFEALNEYGKDFESIHNHIIQKHKKRGVPDNLLITKEHVRYLYYRTWHKISKYLKFSEGTKKIVQELYGLINYGEVRKKIGVYSMKINHKLNELIYNGCVAIRVKGKTVRVKTPMCPALRHLNKLDDKNEEVKLPPRVLVELRPRNMKSFLKVQSMALNPRIQSVLPLQKKIGSLITCISKKWKAAEAEYIKQTFPMDDLIGETNEDKVDHDSICLDTNKLKFAPPKGAKVTVPDINISEYFSSESICLKAFEERMGIESSKYVLSLLAEKKEGKKASLKSKESVTENIAKSPVKIETPNSDKIVSSNTENKTTAPVVQVSSNINSTECGEIPKENEEKTEIPKTEDELIDEALNVFFSTIATNEKIDDNKLPLSNKKSKDTISVINSPQSSKVTKLKKENECLDYLNNSPSCSRSEDIPDNKNKNNISTEEQLCKINRIRSGWTVEDCDTLTIGELYLMIGSASKVVLEYFWVEKEPEIAEKSNSEVSCNDFSEGFECNDALKKLVSIMKLQQKKPTPKCPCGHVCSPKSTVAKKNLKFVGETDEKINPDESLTELESPGQSGDDGKQKNLQFDDFVRPQSKPPPVHLMAQLDSLQKLKPKYSVRKGRRLRTKQLVIERELPFMPKAGGVHQIVRMNIISEKSSNNNQTISSSEDHCEVDTQTTDYEMDSFVDQTIYIGENDVQSSSISESQRSSSEMVLTDELDVPMDTSGEIHGNSETANNLSVFHPESSRSMSPSGILKENANNWITSEVGDFSLSSFLGHLESPMKHSEELSHDVDAHVRSLLTENSFDYTAKFADLANKVAGDTAN